MEQYFFSNQEEWKAARRGIFTSSEIIRLMPNGKRPMTQEEKDARPKSGVGSKVTTIEDPEVLSDGALTYIYEKASEILTQESPEDFYDFNMQWGRDNEPMAVREFAEAMGFDLSDPEFLYCGVSDPVFYTMANIAGGTPDVVTAESVAEVKCPTSPVHLRHLLATAETFRLTFPDKFTQIQSNLLFVGRPYAWFISYDPRYKEKALQLKIIKIEADPEYQNLILIKVNKAKAALDDIIARVFQLNKGNIMIAEHDKELDITIVS